MWSSQSQNQNLKVGRQCDDFDLLSRVELNLKKKWYNMMKCVTPAALCFVCFWLFACSLYTLLPPDIVCLRFKLSHWLQLHVSQSQTLSEAFRNICRFQLRTRFVLSLHICMTPCIHMLWNLDTLEKRAAVGSSYFVGLPLLPPKSNVSKNQLFHHLLCCWISYVKAVKPLFKQPLHLYILKMTLSSACYLLLNLDYELVS